MRTPLLASLAFLLLPLATVHARLGETKEQLEARYGPGEVSGKSSVMVTLLPGAQDVRFQQAASLVNVVIYEGKSVSERVNVKPATRNADAEVIMKANGDGLHWTFHEKDKRWHRSDSKAEGYFYNADWFLVIDTAYAKACEKEKNKKVIGGNDKKGDSKLQGF